MAIFIIGLLAIVGLSSAQNFNLSFQTNKIEVHVDDNKLVPFCLSLPANYEGKIRIVGEPSDKNVAEVEVPVFEGSGDELQWNNSIKIMGMFLGQTTIKLQVITDDDIYEAEELIVIVTRPERLIDTLFTASVAALVSILYINFGCAMDWKTCRETIRRPVGPFIGGICQFILMPLLAFGIGNVLFPDNPEMQIGVFFTGISPSGGASNIWTVLLGGNLNLSIAMTTLSTLASFATIPLWIFTLGRYIFEKGNLVIPYKRIAYMAIGLVIPLGVGYLIQKKSARFSRIMVRIMKPFSCILIIFIVIFGIVTNLYLFELFSWQIILAGMGLPWIGFLCGLVAMTVFQQPQPDIRAIAIETGIQNTGIAIFLLRFSMEQPAADVTTVIPVACAMMTPIPLMFLWMIKIIFEHKKKKLAASMEKLQGDIPPGIPNLSTITQ